MLCCSKSITRIQMRRQQIRGSHCSKRKSHSSVCAALHSICTGLVFFSDKDFARTMTHQARATNTHNEQGKGGMRASALSSGPVVARQSLLTGQHSAFDVAQQLTWHQLIHCQHVGQQAPQLQLLIRVQLRVRHTPLRSTIAVTRTKEKCMLWSLATLQADQEACDLEVKIRAAKTTKRSVQMREMHAAGSACRAVGQ